MTIKGTLETFNLLDLLQMLAFNQKAGTLALDTATGPRTLFVESGSFGFVEGDALPSNALARVLRRTDAVPVDRLERGLSITTNSGRFLGDVLVDLGVLDPERRRSAWFEAVQELFFDLLQTAITRFEFFEGKSLAPDGKEGAAIQPLCVVDGVLLELTRKIDEWAVLKREVPSEDEVYEGTGLSPDLSGLDRVPDHVLPRLLPKMDGRRSVRALVDESDCDRFSVMKVVVELLKQGAVRPAPTEALVGRAEDLLARGAASDAVPLLRRAVDRGEAPPRTRIRLADALEAAADVRAAAAELDTFATQHGESDPAGAFDALLRVMRLRGHEAAASARVCDHWLKYRSRLESRASEATDALQRLVQSASACGQPLEAATRLEAFLGHGDAPNEDLLVLADLDAAGGRLEDAATALVKRAESLVTAGRPHAAGDLLKRALGYDPTRIDARRRLLEIEGAQRRLRHRRRMILLLLLLGLTVGTAATVWLVSDGRAAGVVEAAVTEADGAGKTAEARIAGALKAWNAALASSADASALAAAAASLRHEEREATQAFREAAALASHRITEDAGSSGRASTGHDRLAGIETRVQGLAARIDGALADALKRAGDALSDGEQAFKEGRFRDAKPRLEEALRLSFGDAEDDRTRVERARQRLRQVDTYAQGFAKAREAFEGALSSGDTAEAWRRGIALFATYLDSDLTREVLLPVPVETNPAGATLVLGGAVVPLATPCVLRYSPFGAVDLTLKAPGFAPVAGTLPSFSDVVRREREQDRAPFRVSASLVAGPRWCATTPGGLVAGPFLVGDAAMAVAGDGFRVVSLRASDGHVADVRSLKGVEDRVRLVGRAVGGIWVVLGLRTLAFFPEASGSPWQVQTLGRLDRAPAFGNGLAVLVDETGVAYGVDLATGKPRWRKDLPAAPAQPPYASALGFLVTTLAGEAFALSPVDGTPRPLVTTPGEPTFAAPWRDGAVLLGNAGVRLLSPAFAATPLGPATPDLSRTPALSPEGLAWVEKGGEARVLLLSREGEGPIAVKGVKTCVTSPALGDGTVYALGVDGVLSAARVDAPLATAWTCPLLAPVAATPTLCGDLVLVRTEAGVLGVQR